MNKYDISRRNKRENIEGGGGGSGLRGNYCIALRFISQTFSFIDDIQVPDRSKTLLC